MVEVIVAGDAAAGMRVFEVIVVAEVVVERMGAEEGFVELWAKTVSGVAACQKQLVITKND